MEITIDTITKAKNGDSLAMQEIVNSYKGLLRSVANRFFLVGGDKDDLMQEAMLGLFYAVLNFDESKGAFPAFVKVCVTRNVVNAVKKSTTYKNQPLYNYIELSTLSATATDSLTPLEVLEQHEQSKEILEKIENQLSKTEKQVFLLFIEGYSYLEIAEKTGKSYKAVDGAIQRAKKKLEGQS